MRWLVAVLLLSVCCFLFNGIKVFLSSHDFQNCRRATAAYKLKDVGPNSKTPVNCRQILLGNKTEICSARSSKDVVSEIHHHNHLQDRVVNCSSILREASLYKSNNSYDFPIAYSILWHTDVVQLERLIQLIYQPHNTYCIHVDLKTALSETEDVQRFVSCFPNVILSTQREVIHWGGFNLLKAALNCAKDLLLISRDWKYLINISAQDFPLMTYKETVDVLKSFNGLSDIDSTLEPDFRRYFFKYTVIRDKKGRPLSNKANFHQSNLPVPHGLTIYKGNFAASLSRTFVKFVVNDKKSKELIEWLKDTDVADEHLWATLSSNRALNSPKAQRQRYRTRYVKWIDGQSGLCHGKWVRDVCVFGVGDLAALTDNPSHLFANKLHLNFQPTAYRCMEEWYRGKQRREHQQTVLSG